jgi:hypothetical protein
MQQQVESRRHSRRIFIAISGLADHGCPLDGPASQTVFSPHGQHTQADLTWRGARELSACGTFVGAAIPGLTMILPPVHARDHSLLFRNIARDPGGLRHGGCTVVHTFIQSFAQAPCGGSKQWSGPHSRLQSGRLQRNRPAFRVEAGTSEKSKKIWDTAALCTPYFKIGHAAREV